MATSTTIPLSEYLQTTYRPDRDWIGGELRERTMGATPHASLQAYLSFLFLAHEEEWDLYAFPEQRVQTSADRYRVADLCAASRRAKVEPILREAPALCVEILSRDDTLAEIRERAADYHRMGVATVWVIDPLRRKAFCSTDEEMEEVRDSLTVAGFAVLVPVADIFDRLDRVLGRES